eukprot:scaffold171272_cov35-Tisochrysis_lutea.AAC.1
MGHGAMRLVHRQIARPKGLRSMRSMRVAHRKGRRREDESLRPRAHRRIADCGSRSDIVSQQHGRRRLFQNDLGLCGGARSSDGRWRCLRRPRPCRTVHDSGDSSHGGGECVCCVGVSCSGGDQVDLHEKVASLSEQPRRCRLHIEAHHTVSHPPEGRTHPTADAADRAGHKRRC